MTLLILADAATDATAVRLFRLARETIPTTLLAPVELALAEQWVHRVTGPAVRTTFRTGTGLTVDSDSTIGVFNRLWIVPPPPRTAFGADDRGYAQAELQALVVSWLAGLECPVVNEASPHALCGSPLTALRWQVLAHRAGLETLATRFTTSQRRFPARGMARPRHASADPVAGGARDHMLAVGPAALIDTAGARSASMLIVADDVWPEGLERAEAAALAEPCLRLARAAGVVLMRAHFVSSADETTWLFTAADAAPDVVRHEQLVAILRALTAGHQRMRRSVEPLELVER